MKKSEFLRIPTKEPKRRTRKCALKSCRNPFEPRSTWHIACSIDCAWAVAVEKRKRVERKERQKGLEALKNRSDYIGDAQKAFNAFIRARDSDKTCICCGKPFEPQKPGGSVDAGHYRSRGSSPHLRFDERNCHAQRKNCNRPGGTTHAAFRAGMEARIGLAALEALEADQASRDWTKDDLIAIRAEYKAKLKELKK